MNALGIIGLVLQLIGAVITAHGLIQDWREHGGGRELIPGTQRVASFARRLLGRETAQHVSAGAAVSISAVGALTADGFKGTLPDAPVAEQLDAIRSRLDYLQRGLDRQRELTGRVEQELTRQLNDIAADSRAQHGRLEHRLTSVAIGGARRELFGLLVVAVGSIISAFG